MHLRELRHWNLRMHVPAHDGIWHVQERISYCAPCWASWKARKPARSDYREIISDGRQNSLLFIRCRNVLSWLSLGILWLYRFLEQSCHLAMQDRYSCWDSHKTSASGWFVYSVRERARWFPYLKPKVARPRNLETRTRWFLHVSEHVSLETDVVPPSAPDDWSYPARLRSLVLGNPA